MALVAVCPMAWVLFYIMYFCREAWLAVSFQIIKLFTLSRISLKAMSTLPGMEPLPEVTLPPNPDEKPKYRVCDLLRVSNVVLLYHQG
jgi:hypothetical protein